MAYIVYDEPVEDTIRVNGFPKLAAFMVGRDNTNGYPLMLRLKIAAVEFDIRINDIERLVYEGDDVG